MATNKPAPRKASTVTEPKNADEKPSSISSPEPTPADPPVETKPTPPAPTRHAADENTEKHEADDIKAALSRHTFDGKGDNAVPPSNFRGFETAGVEKAPLKSTDDVVQEILNGSWGTNASVVIERLRAAGYENLDEIEQVYNKRVQAGAPRAF